MATKLRAQSDKYPYASPTTPGLYITFRDYIIELVCINVNPKIGPRFWSNQKYWSPKYKREIRGTANLGKELDFASKLTRTALIEIIQEYNIKALVAKKTISRVIKLVNNRIVQLKDRRKLLADKALSPEIDQQKNATFVDLGEESKVAKIRKAENG